MSLVEIKIAANYICHSASAVLELEGNDLLQNCTYTCLIKYLRPIVFFFTKTSRFGVG